MTACPDGICLSTRLLGRLSLQTDCCMACCAIAAPFREFLVVTCFLLLDCLVWRDGCFWVLNKMTCYECTLLRTGLCSEVSLCEARVWVWLSSVGLLMESCWILLSVGTSLCFTVSFLPRISFNCGWVNVNAVWPGILTFAGYLERLSISLLRSLL